MDGVIFDLFLLDDIGYHLIKLKRIYLTGHCTFHLLMKNYLKL